MNKRKKYKRHSGKAAPETGEGLPVFLERSEGVGQHCWLLPGRGFASGTEDRQWSKLDQARLEDEASIGETC